ncbi:2-C-methyl-D-erythritol 4-phosphate cytidylyltransferase [Halopolyspora algeriensis]|uniref:2-C-methyl-D-erythritol 4-phosphate cytidylyltransferase n=1 Tax=Halopolyspora algeriensis TaxID=1500506 RepID=A0A368VFS6_9ACTN|nr:2-C-methyl-D-erythritol 4-phosphate cytidylyltransferase [Halopolyspora algeriensis]RCW40146.1 2-C-methyl-D-erythritol 4-phosphate cytidylyltransferase [Halopolyspora algeriensis]TQM46372.1 2-C-methyl-D-erythritol 4-phosphate cytidylyltransferase [Halopolyspora algeriensis]
MDVVALVPAAGRGERLGYGMPKALVPVLGEPLLLRAVRGLIGSGCVHHAIVAAPPDAVEEVRAAVAPAGGAVHVVPGGSQRTESVRCALAESARVVPDAAVVLVHDAARAFTPASVIREVVCAVRDGADAVVPVLPVADTIKQVDADDRVTVTVDRARLRSVQTPQGFTPEVLHEAYAAVGDAATDDAGLVERLGRTVATVSGHPQALKITTAFDLAIAEAVLAEPFPGRDRP